MCHRQWTPLQNLRELLPLLSLHLKTHRWSLSPRVRPHRVQEKCSSPTSQAPN